MWSVIFLDVVLAFDKIWHEGLKRACLQPCFKIKTFLVRLFRVKRSNGYYELKEISAGVLTGEHFRPTMYIIYTNYIPIQEEASMKTFSDGSAIIAEGNTIEEVTK